MSELNDCMNALVQIGKREIRKSLEEKPVSSAVAKAMAISAATKTSTGAMLARRILQLERQENVRKAMGIFTPTTEKKRSVRKSSDDELFAELEKRGYNIERA